MDRKQRVFLIDVAATRDTFEGSVLDGELTSDNVFSVFDAYLSCGFDVSYETHSARMVSARRVTGFVKPNQSLVFRVKTFHPVTKMKNFVLETVNAPRVDGYIFTPEFGRAAVGTNYNMFKWKPKNKNTVDFYIDVNKDAWLFNHNRMERAMTRVSQNHGFTDCIVECEYADKQWVPIMGRYDKTRPNSVLTFQKTELNIQENIVIAEFC